LTLPEDEEMREDAYPGFTALGVHVDLTWLPTQLNLAASTTDGLLIFWKAALTAILSRAEPHPEVIPGWHLEYGLGQCDRGPSGRHFPDLAAALNWVSDRCAPAPSPVATSEAIRRPSPGGQEAADTV
jgi:hypothetical protein